MTRFLSGPFAQLALRRCSESASTCPHRSTVSASAAPEPNELRCLEVRTRDEVAELLRACVTHPQDMMALRAIAAEDNAMIWRLDNHQVLKLIAAGVARRALCLTTQAPPPHTDFEQGAASQAAAPATPSAAPGRSGRTPSPRQPPPPPPPRPPPPSPSAPAPVSSAPPADQQAPAVAAPPVLQTAGSAAPPLDPTAATLSFYEVVVLDELDTGIAGVEVELTTPNGTQTLLTDGSGKVRVDEVPPGTGTAHIVSAEQLFGVLKDRVEGDKRRTPLPVADDLLVVTPSRVDTSVSFPDARLQRIMIVSRTDLVWGSVVEHWGDLQLLSPEADPCRLIADPLTSLLKLCSTGAAPSALIGSSPAGADAGDNAAPVDRQARLQIDIDALHDALFASNFTSASALIGKAAVEPPQPPPPPDFPTPSQEGVEFATELALLALQGNVDLTVVPEVQV